MELDEDEPVEISGKSKTILDEYGVDEKFLKKNMLTKVYDWIEFQGWTSLFQEDEFVDKHLVEEFYKTVRKEEKGPTLYMMFNIQGKAMTVSSRDLAYELGLKHDGFDQFTKGHWPEDITDALKEDLEKRVCNYADITKTDLTTLHMDPQIKILHRFLVTTFMPRGSKPSLAQIHDILVLDQMLRKQKVNLPKLILHQMEYISQTNHIGYARFVKKILMMQGAYTPRTEESVMKPLTLYAIHRWSFQLDKDLGWVRKKPVVEEIPVQKPEEKGKDVSPTISNRLDKIDMEMTEVKSLLIEIKTSLFELKTEVDKMSTAQWMIDEELNGLKTIIKTGFAKRN